MARLLPVDILGLLLSVVLLASSKDIGDASETNMAVSPRESGSLWRKNRSLWRPPPPPHRALARGVRVVVVVVVVVLAVTAPTVRCDGESTLPLQSNHHQYDNYLGNALADDDSSTTLDPAGYLYAADNNPNASYPVQEYWESLPSSPNSATITTTTTADDGETIDGPSRTFFWNRQAHHMVEYYQPQCEACRELRESYLALAATIQTVLGGPGHFQAHAVSCYHYPHLCHGITHYPTIRLYPPDDADDAGTVVDVHHQHLHPYTVLQKLGVAYTPPAARIYYGPAASAGHDDDDDMDDVDVAHRGAKLLVEYDAKRVDLEQDVHLAVELMLRHFLFRPANVNTTIATTTTATTGAAQKKARDPPLTAAAADALRHWLALLSHGVPPSTRLHRTVQELVSSFQYVTKHGGYLPVILDEFMTDEGGYSRDCAFTYDFGSGFLCGLWKLLFVLILGVEDYNAVAVRDAEKITAERFVTIVLEYAATVGIGFSDPELNLVLTTSFTLDDDDGDETVSSGKDGSASGVGRAEPQAMRLALWVGAVRNRVQLERLRQQKQLFKHRVMGADVLESQWPPRGLCPACWKTDPPPRQVQTTATSTATTTNTTTTIPARGGGGMRPALWNDEIVYNYVQLEYGRQSASSKERMVRLYKKVHPEEIVEGYNNNHDGSEL